MVDRAIRPACLKSRDSTRKSAKASQNKRCAVGERRNPKRFNVGLKPSRMSSAGNPRSPESRARSTATASFDALSAGSEARNCFSSSSLAGSFIMCSSTQRAGMARVRLYKAIETLALFPDHSRHSM